GHLVQLLPFLLQSVRRRTHISIPPPAPFQVIVVAERESQKVQTRSFFLPVHHPRFLPIDLQFQPVFEFGFRPTRQTSLGAARMSAWPRFIPHATEVFDRAGKPASELAFFCGTKKPAGKPPLHPRRTTPFRFGEEFSPAAILPGPSNIHARPSLPGPPL